MPEIEGILRDAKRDPDLVAKAKANSDADFNADNTVVASVLSKFIDRREKSEEIVNALLKGQNMDTFAQLLAMLGFREYLATVDYHFPNENVAVEVEAQPSQSTAKVNEEAKA
ncbi:helicase, type I site-specific restriction-modification system restriction subunit [Janibacter hoylei PVAS-1]|uniref:Helicase, type I site-specific restriction-modification system restriction subunit n=1 Tax=Janibacter hoylei PVAS-1 TaxID=1210046 RepID=K1E6G2_9MICO|nr:helicase, type I site-specific restriction-modification system restriction subunit [Janibacter hoylei PVAS-1]